jgi:sensor domain CHASE-containing protein
MDLTYCKSQRSKIRKDLKNYFCLYREELEQELNIQIPPVEQIKQMPKAKFDEWIMKNIGLIMKNENIDLELVEKLELFMIFENKIQNSEHTQVFTF